MTEDKEPTPAPIEDEDLFGDDEPDEVEDGEDELTSDALGPVDTE